MEFIILTIQWHGINICRRCQEYFYNDYETSYTTYTYHARWHRCLRYGWSSCGRKPEYPKETHLSDLVTTWPFHMPTPGIEPGSQRWEASTLTLRQPDTKTVGVRGPPTGISYPKKVGNAEKKIEIKDAKRRILTLFEALFWELVLPVVTGPSVNSCFLTCCIDM